MLLWQAAVAAAVIWVLKAPQIQQEAEAVTLWMEQAVRQLT